MTKLIVKRLLLLCFMMMPKVRLKVKWLCMIALCWFGITVSVHASNATSETLNLALICDTHDAASLALTDHLSVELSANSNIAVLDRSEMTRILAEHEMILSANTSTAQMMTIGKLCRADLLVLLIPRNQVIICKIIDIRDGRLLRTGVYSQSDKKYEQSLQNISSSIKDSISKLTMPIDKCKSVVVSRFINHDVSREHDALQEILPELICMYLGSATNIILLERNSLSTLVDENNLNSNEKIDLDIASVLIDGYFDINRKGNNNDISVMLTIASRNLQQEKHFQGPLDAPEKMAREITQYLLHILQEESLDVSVLSVNKEPEYFFQKAQRLRKLGLDLEALPLLESSYYLAPENIKYLEALDDVQVSIAFQGRKATDSPKLQEEKITWYIRNAKQAIDWYQSYPHNKRMPKNINRIFAAMNLYKGTPAEIFYYNSVMARLDYMKLEAKNSPLTLNLIYQLRRPEFLINAVFNAQDEATFIKMFLVCYKFQRWLYTEIATTPEYKDKVLAQLTYFINQVRWENHTIRSSNLENAVKTVFNTISEEEISQINFIIKTVDLLNECMSKQLSEEDIQFKLSILLNLLFESNTNCGSSMRVLYSDLLEIRKYLHKNNDLSPFLVPLSSGLAKHNGVFTPQAAGFTEQLINMWLGGKNSYTTLQWWSKIIPEYLQYLEKANPQLAEETAQRIISRLEKQQTSAEMEEFKLSIVECCYASLKTKPPKVEKTNNYITPTTEQWLFELDNNSSKKFNQQWWMRCYAITYSNDVLHMVCAQIGKKCTMPPSIQLVNYNLKTDSISTGSSLKVPFRLPDPGGGFQKTGKKDIIQLSDGIIICIAGKGILKFDYNGESHVLSEKHGLPVKDILCMTSYVTSNIYVGCKGAVACWSPENKTFDILFSSRFAEDKNPLNGGKEYKVIDIEYDQYHKRLLFILTGGRTGLWSYSLKSKKTEKLLNFSCSDLNSPYRYGDWLYISGHYYFIAYNLRDHNLTKSITLNNHEKHVDEKILPTTKIIISNYSLDFYPAIIIDDNVVYDKGGLRMWSAERGITPIKIKNKYFPSNRQMIPFKDGVIQVLGSKIVYFGL